jgi:hypothetical protein
MVDGLDGYRDMVQLQKPQSAAFTVARRPPGDRRVQLTTSSNIALTAYCPAGNPGSGRAGHGCVVRDRRQRRVGFGILSRRGECWRKIYEGEDEEPKKKTKQDRPNNRKAKLKAKGRRVRAS